MLTHPTLDKLQTLRLHGMLKALNEQLKTPDLDSLSFEERPRPAGRPLRPARSTLVTSQMPVDNWHELIGDPTLADAILGRLVHNAYRINLKGESMRRRPQQLTAPGTSK